MTILNEIIEQSTSIKEVETIDSATLKKEYINKHIPVLIKGFAKSWTAYKEWDFDFLLNLEEDKDVFLLSDNFIQDENRFKKSTFKDFISKLKASETENTDFKEYLTTLDIFNFYPHLKKDIDFSVFNENTTSNEITAWIGPKGTVSGFHADTGKNMYAQIKGKKVFLLSPSNNKKYMYPSDKYILGATASQVDINNFDEEKFPDFKKAKFINAFLEPGDVLYVPKNWWHYVQSLSPSISISDFGYFPYEKYTMKVAERIKYSLHKRGYYKKRNCFCCGD